VLEVWRAQPPARRGLHPLPPPRPWVRVRGGGRARHGALVGRHPGIVPARL
jgi:hypothetical protein